MEVMEPLESLLEATDALKDVDVDPDNVAQGQAALLKYLERVSVKTNGLNKDAVTVLYSGYIGKTPSSDIIKTMEKDSNVRTLDKTLAYKILNNEKFIASRPCKIATV